MPPKGSKTAKTPKPEPKSKKQGKKPVSAEKAAALQAAVLRDLSKAAFKDFPVSASEECLCVLAALGEDGGKKLTTIYAFEGDRANVFRNGENSTRYISVPVGTPLFAVSMDGQELSWSCGKEPELGITRPDEQKEGVAPLREKKELSQDELGEYREYGVDAPTVSYWDNEVGIGKSGTADAFKIATIEAVDELFRLEKSVIDIPSKIIPVIVATPIGFGPDALFKYSEGWYSTSLKWMSPPGSGFKDWRPAGQVPVTDSAASLAVFRNSSGAVIRSSFADFLKTSDGAESFSLDDLEKLIPKVKLTPLDDRDILMKRLEDCVYGQLKSGDYIVGVKERYWVFRLDKTPGIPPCIVPGDLRDFAQDLPDGSNYVAYRYTELPDESHDQAERFDASVTNKTLTIGSAAGGPIEIWPKDPDRRQAIIDGDKPARLRQEDALKGQWRRSLSKFCAHHHLANGDVGPVVVFPMEPCAETGNYSWHVTFPSAKVRDYLGQAGPPTGSADPPPSLEDLWNDVEKGHVSIEWHGGAWDNPVNPRIFNGSGNWSYLAKVGTLAAGGRQTKDPFSGKMVATRVTPTMKDRYTAYTKKYPASAVVDQIRTKNILP